MTTNSRRSFIRIATASTGAYILSCASGPLLYRSDSPLRLCVEMGGKIRNLVQVDNQNEAGVAHAQSYGYWNYQYRPPYVYVPDYQYVAWNNWNAAAYREYMQSLAQQYAWVQRAAYQQQVAALMQRYYNIAYHLSQPFAVPQIQSLYSYGNDPSGVEVLIGFSGRKNREVEVSGRAVRLASAVAGFCDYKGIKESEKEEAFAPQTSSRSMQMPVGGRLIAGVGFGNEMGNAFLSTADFQDENSGATGKIVAFDTKHGKELSLVQVSA